MAYPSTIDAFPNPTSATLENAAGFEHDVGHSALGDGLEAVMTELGTLPKGSAASVKARLTAMDAVDALRVVGSNQTTAPSSPVVGQVWVDHSTPATPVIKVWSGSAWVNPSSAGSGGAALVWATVTGGTVTTVTNPDGSTDEVHTFTANGTLTVSASGYADCLIVGGGAAGYTGNPGSAGDVVRGMFTLPAGAHAVTVGAGGPDGNSDMWGRPSSIAALLVTSASGQGSNYNQSAGAGGTVPTSGGPNPGPLNTGVLSSITGTAVEYAKANQTSPRTNMGDGRNGVIAAGGSGVVIVRVKVTPAPVLPAATGWAQITGGTVTEYTKPDGSVMEVHTFTAAGSLTVVAAGYADVFMIGGGSGDCNYPGYVASGGGGRIVDGKWALAAGAQAVVIGAGGVQGSTYPGMLGKQSSLGSLSTGFGAMIAASGPSAFNAPVTSDITGTAQTYGGRAPDAPVSTPRANRGDGNSAGNGSTGVVIVAVQKTPPTASGVVASGGTETTFTGDGTNGVLGQGYKVHKFTTDSSLVVTAGGACEVLLISGGSAVWTAASYGGGGGTQWLGTLQLGAGTYPVDVGAGGVQSATYASTWGKPSSIAGKATTDAFPNAGTGGGPGGGFYTANIDGTSRTYCGGNSGSASSTTIGDGGAGASPGNPGVVIVRYRV